MELIKNGFMNVCVCVCVCAASRAPPAQNGAFGLAAGMNGYASPAMPPAYPYPYPSMPQAGYNPYPQAPAAAGTVRLCDLENHVCLHYG